MARIFIEGGVNYMIPLTLIFIANFVIAGMVVGKWFRSRTVGQNALESIRQLAILALAFGTFSTVLGLFRALSSLSQMTEPLPFNVVMGGLSVALITVCYGLIIFLVSMIIFLVLRNLKQAS